MAAEPSSKGSQPPSYEDAIRSSSSCTPTVPSYTPPPYSLTTHDYGNPPANFPDSNASAVLPPYPLATSSFGNMPSNASYGNALTAPPYYINGGVQTSYATPTAGALPSYNVQSANHCPLGELYRLSICHMDRTPVAPPAFVSMHPALDDRTRRRHKICALVVTMIFIFVAFYFIAHST